MRGAAHKKWVIWLTTAALFHTVDGDDESTVDLRRQLAETAVTGPLLIRDSGVSRDDECEPVSYGPFRPEKAKKIESTDPRVSGGATATMPPRSRRA